jgi:hypothetical protein
MCLTVRRALFVDNLLPGAQCPLTRPPEGWNMRPRNCGEIFMFKPVIFATASLIALSGAAFAKDTMPAYPRFAVQPGLRPNVHKATALPTWTFQWTYSGRNYSAIFVGANPSSATSTTIPVEIIPVIMKVGTTTENPKKKVGGVSVIDRVLASPIFDSTTSYTQGGTAIGATQYEDAFQKAALWGIGGSASGYHVLLGTPKVEKAIKLTGQSVGTEFGIKVILANINTFDNAIQSTIAKLPANSLPIFVTTQTYLTSGGCCIGGYHSYTGTQAYSMFTYIQNTGNTTVFSQDVSAMSHEIGEWMDDPETNNSVACGIYEVGDPLEGGQPGHPYGTWTYALGGFTYHLQDLVLPPYFGATPSTSINSWSTFQGYTIGVCSNGG